MIVGLFGLVFYGAFQFVPIVLGGLDPGDRTTRSPGGSRSTPPGSSGGRSGRRRRAGDGAAGHLALGVALAAVPRRRVHVVGDRRSPSRHAWPSSDGRRHRRRRRRRRSAGSSRRAVRIGRRRGRSPGAASSPASARRAPRSRRSPAPASGSPPCSCRRSLRDTAGSGAVLVGGAIQLAVLFMSGNSFGSDGPAAHPRAARRRRARRCSPRGKARSIAIVAAPLAVIGPVLAADDHAASGEYLVGRLGGRCRRRCSRAPAAAIVQSALVPVAIPDSDNPSPAARPGKGMMAALLLCVVLARPGASSRFPSRWRCSGPPPAAASRW